MGRLAVVSWESRVSCTVVPQCRGNWFSLNRDFGACAAKAAFFLNRLHQAAGGCPWRGVTAAAPLAASSLVLSLRLAQLSNCGAHVGIETALGIHFPTAQMIGGLAISCYFHTKDTRYPDHNSMRH